MPLLGTGLDRTAFPIFGLAMSNPEIRLRQVLEPILWQAKRNCFAAPKIEPILR